MKHITDLDMALVQYEQNLHIPEVHLSFPPYLVQAADECRRAGRLLSPSELGWEEKPSESFRKDLVALKTQWGREICTLVNHTRDLKSGNTIQEINYWNGMKTALESLRQQLDSYEVQLVFAVLRSINLTTSIGMFISATGFRQKLEGTAANVEFLNGLPMNRLFACTDFVSLKNVIEQIFAQLPHVRNTKAYSVARTHELMNSICKDVLKQCIAIMTPLRLMDDDYETFSAFLADCLTALDKWDEGVALLWPILKELREQRGETNSVLSVNALKPLIDHLREVSQFRYQHHRFVTVLQEMTGCIDPSIVGQLQSAYDLLRHVNISDLNEAALKEWRFLMKDYGRCIEQVDQRLADTLRSQLSNAQSTDAMFVIFKRFSELISRPCIQGWRCLLPFP